MAFFDDWALWIKMCFVLAVAIIVTVAAGFIKLWLDNRQLKKFTALEQRKMEEQPMVEEIAARERRGREDISPFGVRALESGVEVEGVWISRGNSPASSAPGSPLQSPSMKGKAVMRSSEIPTLIIPEQINPPSFARTQSSSSSLESFERATSAERIYPSTQSPTLRAGPRIAHRPHQPSSLRYSTAGRMEAGEVYKFKPSIKSNYVKGLDTGSIHERSASDSSDSSNNTIGALQPTAYQHLRLPSYYLPKIGGTTSPSSSSSSRVEFLRPEYAGASRSARSSYAAQGYTYGVLSSPQPPVQRFHYPSRSQSSIGEEDFVAQGETNRSYLDSQAPVQQEALMESVELTKISSLDSNRGEKAKRVRRKLQKKPPGA